MRLSAVVLLLCGLPAVSFAQDCNFSYKPESLKVEWTGYKFTEKTGAKGQFRDFKLDAPSSAKSLEELLTGTSIVIDPVKLATGDVARDINLQNAFFKKLKTPTITGKVVSYSPAISKISVQMNGVTKVIAFRMKIDGNKYLGETDIDILDFKMQKPLDSLNKACKDLHKGTDGKTKTWSQVSLAISAEIVDSCQAGGSK